MTEVEEIRQGRNQERRFSTMKKRTAKTKKRELLMPISVHVMRDGWAKLVTRPEHLRDDDLYWMDVLVARFIKPGDYGSGRYRAAKLLFELHYQTFADRDRVVIGRMYTRSWASLTLEERREIYRSVGLSLGYDF